MEDNSTEKKAKLTKDSLPENFTMGLAMVDFIPVLFFGINAVLIGILLKNPVFVAGALLCFLTGAVKVLWKILIVKIRKNIWPLFVQMRIVMPAAFLIMLVSVFLPFESVSLAQIGAAIIALPQVIFFGLGILGMILMIVFTFVLNNSDVKSNWIEQLTNGLSQIFICMGLLTMLI